MKNVNTIDEYIANFSGDTRSMLSQLRKVVAETAKDAEETISYQMPLFKFHGRLVYFSAHKNHIGFYPFKSAITKFKKELKNYKTGPGTVQFPIGQDMPLKLIKKIVQFRVKENLAKDKKHK